MKKALSQLERVRSWEKPYKNSSNMLNYSFGHANGLIVCKPFPDKSGFVSPT